ncbi:MAG: D-alanyl-D-alanine carboxypeptidase, partial [Gammaproteobacteria bacterium]|nr:D-alanyl-D-alanine carboxypeptidase [Gammaproteobacteria bacterium]
MSIRKRLILALFFALTGFKSALAANVIPNDLGQIIKASGFDQTNIGLYVQAVNTAKPVVQLNDSKKFNPASVIKLVTTSVALDLLGPGYQWSTDVYYTGELQGDRLNGDLYFVGNGDPYLTPERFWRLLNRVRIFGIREIQGDVYFDSSFFQPEPIDYAAFDDQPYRTYNVGPNALLVGFQATEFHFDVDASKQRVKIIAFPASPNLKVINQMQLSNGTCRAWQKRLLLEPKIIHQVLQVKFSGQYARSCG